MDKKDFIKKLANLRPNSTFITLLGYRNAYSEVADYSLAFHISYENALNKSISKLEEYIPKDDLEKLAKRELIDAYNKSLAKIKSVAVDEIDDNYTRFFNDDGSYIKGVKILTKTGELHLYGLVANKKVLIPGSYGAPSNKKELTVVKDRLRKMTTVDKFRQFKILPNQLDSISIEKLSLLPPV